jgi:hypothetical protein
VKAHTFTTQAVNNLNERLLARKLIATVFFENKRVLLMEFRTGHNNAKSLMRNTKKTV